jgi:ABC-type antimicrobial peptide transport system permease subunit
VRTGALVIASSFAMAIGAFFGLYPAVKASRLAPVAALRAE